MIHCYVVFFQFHQMLNRKKRSARAAVLNIALSAIEFVRCYKSGPLFGASHFRSIRNDAKSSTLSLSRSLAVCVRCWLMDDSASEMLLLFFRFRVFPIHNSIFTRVWNYTEAQHVNTHTQRTNGVRMFMFHFFLLLFNATLMLSIAKCFSFVQTSQTYAAVNSKSLFSMSFIVSPHKICNHKN